MTFTDTDFEIFREKYELMLKYKMRNGTSDVWIMILKAIYTKLNANSDTFYSIYTKCKYC